MLYTISFKHFDRAIIHFNRQIYFCFSLWIFNDFKHFFIDVSDFHRFRHDINNILIWIVCF